VPPYYSQHAVFVSPLSAFSLVEVFDKVDIYLIKNVILWGDLFGICLDLECSIKVD